MKEHENQNWFDVDNFFDMYSIENMCTNDDIVGMEGKLELNIA